MVFSYTSVRVNGDLTSAIVVRWSDADVALGRSVTSDDVPTIKTLILAAGGPGWVADAFYSGPTDVSFLLVKNQPM